MSPPSGRVQAGPDERVDDEVGAEHVGAVQLPGRRVGDLDDVETEMPEHVEIGPRVALHARRFTEEIHGDVDLALAAACARRRTRRRRCCRGRTATATRIDASVSNVDSIAATT